MTSGDIEQRLPGWFASARTITTTAGLAGVAAELRTIQVRMNRAGFTVAVVGELGRGKSTVINALLGREVLPPGVHPPFPVLITGGDEEYLEMTQAGSPQRLPATKESWSSLVAEPPAGVEPVRLGVAGPLLDGLDLEIVDTPGGNDLDTEVVESVRVAAATADAVIMVVAATAALSLTETHFLVEYVLDAQVPHVVLVVSKLDLVEAGERERVLAHVVDRAAATAPGIVVLPGPTPSSMNDNEVAAIRAWLAEASGPAQRSRLRASQLARQLAASLDRVVVLVQQAQRSAALDAQQRADEAAAARAQLAEELLVFDEYRIELRRRQSDAANRFRGHLEAARTYIVDLLQFDLRHSSDPGTWWERDMPYRLRRELATLGREYEKSLLATAEVDLTWLNKQLAQRFGSAPAALREVVGALATPAAEPSALDLPDLRNRKLAYRLGPAGVALVGILLIPGVGPLATIGASIAGTVLGEVKLRAEIDRQRKYVEQRLAGLVDRAIGEFGTTVAERLRRLYDQLLDEAVRLRQSWYTDRTAALARPALPSTAISSATSPAGEASAADPDWALLAVQARQLVDEITTAIAEVSATEANNGTEADTSPEEGMDQ